VHQNEPTTNPTTAGDKTETKVAAVPQDKVTISAPAKQASTENANETSGAGETQQAGH
jgi:hypothetical protein